MTSIERLFASIETEPWNAIYRAAAGFSLPPLFHALCANCDSIWITFEMFLGFLVALRAVPLVLRYTLPFSAEVKGVWARQRNLSKEFDSYAWQKLLWVGAGFLIYAAIVGGLRNSEVAVMLFCLISGGAGLWRWRTVRTEPASAVATGTAP